MTFPDLEAMPQTLEQAREAMEGCADSEWANYMEGLVRQHERYCLVLREQNRNDRETLTLTRDQLQEAWTERDARRERLNEFLRELESLRSFKRSVDEALNRGDGAYRP